MRSIWKRFARAVAAPRTSEARGVTVTRRTIAIEFPKLSASVEAVLLDR